MPALTVISKVCHPSFELVSALIILDMAVLLVRRRDLSSSTEIPMCSAADLPMRSKWFETTLASLYSNSSDCPLMASSGALHEKHVVAVRRNYIALLISSLMMCILLASILKD